MGNAYASLGLRSPDRVPPVLALPAVGFVTPPHRAAAGGPPEAEDGRGGPGRALSGKVSVSVLERLTMCTTSLSLAKPGEAMPGPYSSLMVLRRRASRSGPGRAVRGTKSGDNADGALIRLFTSNKDSGTRRGAVHATVRSGSCPPQLAQPFRATSRVGRRCAFGAPLQSNFTG